jgi:hypothetical protein
MKRAAWLNGIQQAVSLSHVPPLSTARFVFFFSSFSYSTSYLTPASVVVIGLEQEEVGFRVWTSVGIEAQTHRMNAFDSLHWRPRPKCLLTKDAILVRPRNHTRVAPLTLSLANLTFWLQEIETNKTIYAKKFEAQDANEDTQVEAQELERRRALFDEFADIMSDKLAKREALGLQLSQLRPSMINFLINSERINHHTTLVHVLNSPCLLKE